MPDSPDNILENAYIQVAGQLATQHVVVLSYVEKIIFLCRCEANRAPVRFLMSCVLAKIHRPELDVRKPYTEIGGTDSFSGRTYDEKFIHPFVIRYKLPVNHTTAYLTPTFRNHNQIFTIERELVGRPRQAYIFLLEILHHVQAGSVDPQSVLQEVLRQLLFMKHESEQRMQQLLASLGDSTDKAALSSEQIVTLLHQHLNCRNASRLPVLMVAAAYMAVKPEIGESIRLLMAHNAADSQTGSVGDLEITVESDERLATCYEMKNKKITIDDIQHALTKINMLPVRIDNYIFITTDVVEHAVKAYATTLYDDTGVEMAILDCLGFMRHYLHFFHRHRSRFLDIYQELVLKEPISSVAQPLKEAFLSLRRAVEADR